MSGQGTDGRRCYSTFHGYGTVVRYVGSAEATAEVIGARKRSGYYVVRWDSGKRGRVTARKVHVMEGAT